jgi:hypothetical protein
MDLDWVDNVPSQENTSSNIGGVVKVGDRVRMVNMPDDPDPIEPGTEGTVTKVQPRVDVIDVKWDNGRTLNLVMGVDEFTIISEGASDKSIINKSMPKPTLKGRDMSSTRTKFNKKYKSELQKGKVKDIKVENEELEGGIGDGMSIEDIAEKHGVSIKDIQNEIEVGIEVEMEHTHDPMKAKEVTIDHLVEFPDYYTNKDHGLKSSEKELEKVHENTILENFFGAMGNAFGKKKDPDDQYDNMKLVKDLKKITDTIKTANFQQKETIQNMLETFRGKYSEHSMIDTMMKSLYHEFDNIGGEIDETTSAGGMGAGYQYSGKLESRIIKVSDLLESTTTTNSGKYDAESKTPFDDNKDGWFWNDEPFYEDGEIVDDIAQLDTNWKDDLLSVKMTKEELVKTVNILEDEDENKDTLNEGFSWLLTGIAVYSFYKFIQGLRGKDKPKESNYGKSDWGSLNVYVRDFIKQGGKINYEENYWFHVFEVGDVTIKIDKQKKTVFWTHIVPDIRRFLKYKPKKRYEFDDIHMETEHEYTIPIPISQEIIDSLVDSIKQDNEEGLDETTTASSSGQYTGPMFAAKDDDDWRTAKKPIWKGGQIVQKVKNSGVLSEINKVKWHKDGTYVKLKDSCTKFRNQPWCDAGDASKPLKLSKTTSDNITEVAKKLGISEKEVKKVVIKRLSR